MVSKRLVLISDTHGWEPTVLPEPLRRAIRECDLLVHAGDFNRFEMYEGLKRLAPLVAALGNTDDGRLRAVLPEFVRFEVLGHTLAVAHGWGAPEGIPARLAHRYDLSGCALVVFGHSHCAEITGHGGILFVNPGSPVDRRHSSHHSYGVVEVTEEGVGVPEIVRL